MMDPQGTNLPDRKYWNRKTKKKETDTKYWHAEDSKFA